MYDVILSAQLWQDRATVLGHRFVAGGFCRWTKTATAGHRRPRWSPCPGGCTWSVPVLSSVPPAQQDFPVGAPLSPTLQTKGMGLREAQGLSYVAQHRAAAASRMLCSFSKAVWTTCQTASPVRRLCDGCGGLLSGR